MTYVYIILGAMAGAPLRYFLGNRVAGTEWLAPFPLGTLLVNLSGCLAIGVLLGLADSRDFLSREARLLLVTGFLGSYTTFSAFGWETYDLIRNDDVVRAALYAGLSVGLGVLAVWAGATLARAA